MIPALHRGKLPWETRQLLTTREDAVTGTVLGLLRYLSWDDGLGAMLGRCGLSGTAPGEVRFWPRFSGTEPDALLAGDDWAALLEAKVGAAFGERQLGREWRILREQGAGCRLRLVTVTPEPLPAGDAWARTCADLQQLGDEGRAPTRDEVVSLRWHDLLPPDGAQPAAVREDLVRYLSEAGLLRERFAAFGGVAAPALPARVDWYRRARARWFDLAPPPAPSTHHWYAT